MSPARELQNVDFPLKAIEDSVSGGDLLLLNSVRRRASRTSLPVYIVGGSVRDVLLGGTIEDLDFVVEGDAPQLALQLSSETGGQLLVHRRFRTATVTLGESRIDVVSARKEVYTRPGALPDVSPGTIRDDLARRDFSINALALPLWEDSPEIIDFHGGMEDLLSGAIRTLHPGSFVDDPTRILRAIRYEQRLGFALESHTLSQMQDTVDRGFLSEVSGARLRHELERILQEAYPGKVLIRALHLGVMAEIHPALASVSALEQLKGAATSPVALDPLQWLSALSYHLSASSGDALIQRLSLPNEWATVVRDTIELRERESRLVALAMVPSQVAEILDGIAPAATAAVSLVTESPQVELLLGRYLEEYRFQIPALNGRDLQRMGVPAGAMVGRILRTLRRAKLDGKVGTEEEERELVKSLLASHGGQESDG